MGVHWKIKGFNESLDEFLIRVVDGEPPAISEGKILNVQQIHKALKSAGYQCALRFPGAAGLDPDKPVPGYRITRKDFGWEITNHDGDGKQVPVEHGHHEALKSLGRKTVKKTDAVHVLVESATRETGAVIRFKRPMVESYDYSCALVEMPKSVADRVKAFSKTIPDEDMPADKDSIQSDGAKAGGGRETEIHVTALFGIHTENVDEVKEAIKGIHPIRLRLGKTGMFAASENRDSDVLWVSVQSDDLHQLNKTLREKLEYTNAYEDYKPHLTVAYLKPGTAKKYVGREIVADEFIIDCIEFSSKSGAKTAIHLT